MLEILFISDVLLSRGYVLPVMVKYKFMAGAPVSGSGVVVYKNLHDSILL